MKTVEDWRAMDNRLEFLRKCDYCIAKMDSMWNMADSNPAEIAEAWCADDPELVREVLSTLLYQNRYDGRIDQENIEWAKKQECCWDVDRKSFTLIAKLHKSILNTFARYVVNILDPGTYPWINHN